MRSCCPKGYLSSCLYRFDGILYLAQRSFELYWLVWSNRRALPRESLQKAPVIGVRLTIGLLHRVHPLLTRVRCDGGGNTDVEALDFRIVGILTASIIPLRDESSGSGVESWRVISVKSLRDVFRRTLFQYPSPFLFSHCARRGWRETCEHLLGFTLD